MLLISSIKAAYIRNVILQNSAVSEEAGEEEEMG